MCCILHSPNNSQRTWLVLSFPPSKAHSPWKGVSCESDSQLSRLVKDLLITCTVWLNYNSLFIHSLSLPSDLV